MDTGDFGKWKQAADILEAREMILKLKVATYRDMKEGDRSRLLNNLQSIGFPESKEPVAMDGKRLEALING